MKSNNKNFLQINKEAQKHSKQLLQNSVKVLKKQ